MNDNGTTFQAKFIAICGTSTLASALVAVVGGNVAPTSGLGVALMPFEAVALFVGLLSPLTTVLLFLLSLYVLRRMSTQQVVMAALSCLFSAVGAVYWLIRFFFGFPTM